MTATLVLIAAGGITMGFFVRANALAAGSLVVLVWSLSRSVISGQDVLGGAAISVAYVALLQAGYLAGLLLSGIAFRKDTKPHSKNK